MLKSWLYFILISILFSCFEKEDSIEITNDCTNSRRVKNDTSSIRFFIISDWGFNGSFDQISVARQMGKMAINIQPEFIISCGDNFQYEGVKSVDDSLWKINYEQVYNDVSLEIPWYPALGNHDYLGNVNAQIEYSKKNKYWRMPARYYTFIKGFNKKFKIRFIVLDTPDLVINYDNLADTTNIDSIVQIKWLRGILSDSKQDWIIIIGHHPIYSAGSHHGDTKELIYLLKPLLESYKADFYISGHDHDFEHIQLPGKPLDYIVTGTGSLAWPIMANFRTVFCLSSLGFTYMTITAKTANFQFITEKGETVYSYTKTKPDL